MSKAKLEKWVFVLGKYQEECMILKYHTIKKQLCIITSKLSLGDAKVVVEQAENLLLRECQDMVSLVLAESWKLDKHGAFRYKIFNMSMDIWCKLKCILSQEQNRMFKTETLKLNEQNKTKE